ncbi:MAG: hypothetical protein IKB01_04715 [Lachnospiraceae bacterium]|nr:hypothetical protein [Lachnospiraceae bacterium]
MSQAKVDRYKEDKKNRKEIMAKEKRANMLRALAGGAVLVVILGWIGVSAYDMYQANQPLETIYVDTTAVDEYVSTLNAE